MTKIIALILCCVILLTGCSKGLDTKFDASSQEALGESFKKMVAGATEQEANIFKAYATQMLGSYMIQSLAVQLTGKAPEVDLSTMTGRQFLSSYLNNLLKKNEESLQQLAVQKELSAEMEKIKIENFSYNGYEVAFDVTNGSSIPLHVISVHLKLYIDGQSEPAAESTAFQIFNDGLAPGRKAKAVVEPGGVFGRHGGWDKLSVRKAVNPRMNIVLTEIEDYDKHKIMIFDPSKEQEVISKIAELKTQIGVIAKK